MSLGDSTTTSSGCPREINVSAIQPFASIITAVYVPAPTPTTLSVYLTGCVFHTTVYGGVPPVGVGMLMIPSENPKLSITGMVALILGLCATRNPPNKNPCIGQANADRIDKKE